MNMITKTEVLKANLNKWLGCKGMKKERGQIIKEISEVLGIHRKAVGRSFKRIQLLDKSKKTGVGRKIIYGPEVNNVLYDVWKTLDYVCAENLTGGLKSCIENLQKFKHWKHDKDATELLMKMSLGTMKNRVGKLKKKYFPTGKGRTCTRPSPLKDLIPTFKGPWDTKGPGCGQLDTVAHCDDNMHGDFMYTVNYTDFALYWIVLRAQWQKGEKATTESLKYIKNVLPFVLLELHPDGGTEFINWPAKRWTEANNIVYTRSRSGKKNDNMCVEERNGNVIRKYMGYQRYDKHELIDICNQYYKYLCLYLNYFAGVRRTVSKHKLNSKYIRKYEEVSASPYQRLIKSTLIPENIKQKQKDFYDNLNLFEIKEKIATLEGKIKEILSGKPIPQIIKKNN